MTPALALGLILVSAALYVVTYAALALADIQSGNN